MPPAVKALRCPVCGAPVASGPRCAYCGTPLAVRGNHPAPDAEPLDRDVPRTRLDEFRQRLRRNPADVEARHLLGVAYFDLGLMEDGVRELRAAVHLEPESAALQTELAMALFGLGAAGARGARQEARERAALALRLDPNLPEVLLVKAMIQAADGDWRAAVVTLHAALAHGGEGFKERVVALLTAFAEREAAQERWLDAAHLWHEVAAVEPEAVRVPLMHHLREHQRTLLSPPRWSWLAAPPRWGFERGVRYAAATTFSALAALALFVILGTNEATVLLSLVPCLLTVVAPVVIYLWGRRRLRRRSAPHPDVMRAIRADPAAFFTGRPDPSTILAAADYVASELQGAAIAGAHPWVAGRTSPGMRRAWRAASVRAPWLPDGEHEPRR